MAKTDAEIARGQWLRQMVAIRKADRAIFGPLAGAYRGALDRWAQTGAVSIPVTQQRDLAAALASVWRNGSQVGFAFPMDADKGAFPMWEVKEEQSLFQQIMDDFISRFGAERVQGILSTTRRQLQDIIAAGVADGLGQDGIAQRILEAIPRFTRTRARLIARTETHNSAMFASQEVARTAVTPMRKRWISVYDARTRDFGEADGEVDQANHRAMHEVTIDMDEMFQVPRQGGVDLMMAPGDPGAPAYQVCNCRCALIYRRAGRDWPTSQD